MTVITKVSFRVGVALTLSNFIYQLFTNHSWGQAAERSFFQLSAIIILWLAYHEMRKP